MKITAKVDTKLKKQPLASAMLSAEDAIAVAAGKSYGVDDIKPAVNGHSRVVLAANSGTFYVFNLHWDGLSTEIVSRATAEHIFDRQISSELLSDLNACCDRFEINTPSRLRHFLSQISAESGGLQYLKEIDLGWYIPKDFNLPEIAASDGGYKYRGAGLIQLSMPDNYLAFSKAMGDPEIYNQGCPYVAEHYAATSAGFWWEQNEMNKLCDSGADVWAISRAVNLGNAWSDATPNGIDDRIFYYDRACNVI